ncbi:(Fe-S)-binding protein [Desulfarculus baarsii]
MEYAEILHRCFRCGYCKLPSDYSDLSCPSYLKYRFETFSPGGRMWLLRGWLDGQLQTSPRLQEIIYSCAACGNCVEHCNFPKFKDHILDAFIAARGLMVEEGQVPPTVRDYFKAIQQSGNPYKAPQSARGNWAKGLDLAAYAGQEYLFYAGDVASYDERAQMMARAAVTALKERGVDFGVLGASELADGNETRVLGERMLFEVLAQANIEQWQGLGVQKIVTVDPHAYHAIRNHYPALGGQFEVFHYSQLLAPALKAQPPAGPGRAVRVAFHDPCYLGRHNGEFKAPRKALQATPGVELIELPRARKNALCCGGGGGNFFTDIVGAGPGAPARERVREAVANGAEVLAVACPNCLKMLSDAVKAENLDERLAVKDLAELALGR